MHFIVPNEFKFELQINQMMRSALKKYTKIKKANFESQGKFNE